MPRPIRLLDLPPEILLHLVNHLTPSSKVCLALSSHHLYVFVTTATRTRTLDQPLLSLILPHYPQLPLLSLHDNNEVSNTVRQLVTFIPYTAIKMLLRNREFDERWLCFCYWCDGSKYRHLNCRIERNWATCLKNAYDDAVAKRMKMDGKPSIAADKVTRRGKRADVVVVRRSTRVRQSKQR